MQNFTHFTDDSESEVIAQYHTKSVEDTELEPRSLHRITERFVLEGTLQTILFHPSFSLKPLPLVLSCYKACPHLS